MQSARKDWGLGRPLQENGLKDPSPCRRGCSPDLSSYVPRSLTPLMSAGTSSKHFVYALILKHQLLGELLDFKNKHAVLVSVCIWPSWRPEYLLCLRLKELGSQRTSYTPLLHLHSCRFHPIYSKHDHTKKKKNSAGFCPSISPHSCH